LYKLVAMQDHLSLEQKTNYALHWKAMISFWKANLEYILARRFIWTWNQMLSCIMLDHIQYPYDNSRSFITKPNILLEKVY
jgi:hypothetical protein